jgi:hypothetical protein
VTLATYRCVPRRGRCRPRPSLLPEPADRPRPVGFVQAAVDAYLRTGIRPPWLSDELLRILGQRGGLVGIIYLVHFDRPVGDVSNPRGFASHYTGWTLDLAGRLVDHAEGRGARLMEVVCEAGIGWQLARLWVGTRARERSLKGSGGAARRCPVCRLAALGLQPPRPVDPLALELGDRVATWAGLPVPLPELPAVAA